MGEVIHGFSLKLQSSGERAMLTLIGYGAACALLVFAFAAFVYAAATALTAAYGPVASASILGGGAIVLSLVVFAWLAYRRRKLAREIRMRRLAQPAVAGMAATMLPAMMRTSPLGTLLAVAAAAYVFQRSTQRRP